MVSNKNKLLETLRQFESDIAKPVPFNVRQYHSFLTSLNKKIIMFLKMELKNSTDNSGALEMITEALKLIYQEAIGYKFFTTPTQEELRAARIKIQNLKWDLRTELKMLRELVERGLIVEASRWN